MSAGRWLQALAGGMALPALFFTSALADATYSAGCISGGSFFTGSANCVFMERNGPGGIARIYKIEEPRGEARSDTWIVCELAKRLGLGKEFFEGDVDAGHRYTLEPTGVTLEALRASPQGVRVPAEVR